MNHHRQIWRGLAEIIEAHGSLPPSAYWEHYFDVYAETQAMAVRRQADTHPDVASLGKLLSEVSEDVKQLTPEWWIALWSIGEDDDYERAFAHRQWDDEFGGQVGVHLDPAIPAADLKRLSNGSRAVRKHVDKHIAHSEDPGPIPKDPGVMAPEDTLELSEVHDAIDVIGEAAHPLLLAIRGGGHGRPGAGDPARLARALPGTVDSGVSSDIAYSLSPAASRASSRVAYMSIVASLPPRTP